MKVDLHNLPPELTEPPADARGWLAWQPSTGNAWRRVDGVWLPIAEANAIVKARKKK
ncbi:hypothetical protein LPJ38_26810 [Bradyrhizobium daqingense]|uniref:hypothetical protein n=1 Tax=Bradyrhizobium daqingense TaxID=993502 RepID=UPI0013152D3B|nr:hypothetical protein [Bradyrhizobium daqingense]UFS87240.1 hypothetical protein LPJ38_26810 [Bradyrhizobium daqingense]